MKGEYHAVTNVPAAVHPRDGVCHGYDDAVRCPLCDPLQLSWRCTPKDLPQGSILGFLVLLFVIAVKQGTRNAVSREGFEGLMAFLLCSVRSCSRSFFYLLAKKMERRWKIFQKAVAVNVLAVTLYYGMEIWLIPVTTVLNVSDIVSVEMLIRMLGFASGLFFGGLSSWLIYHAAKSLNDTRLHHVYLIQLFALFLQQGIYLVQILMARGILPARQLMKVMAPIINHQDWFIFVVFVVFTVPVALFSQRCPEKTIGENPAEYRKVVALDRHKNVGERQL